MSLINPAFSNIYFKFAGMITLHPVAGFSFEGFAIQQIIEPLPDSYKPFFYRTQDGTECDLVITKNFEVKICVEIKLTTRPSVTRSMRLAMDDLKPSMMYIVTPIDANYWLDEKIQVVGVKQLSLIMKNLSKQEGH
jgi:predicted AAA+ superfamily ATPase